MIFFVKVNKIVYYHVLIFVFLLVSSLYCIAEPDIVNRCVTCHTITGNSSVAMWPKIAEQHSDYMFKQLIEFKKGKNGDRFDPTMFGMLQGINEADLYVLSEYFSKQVVSKSIIKVSKEEYTYGKNIYLFGDRDNKVVGCVGCHGLDGTGNKLAKYPSLKWQHKDYIVIQLKKFKSGERSNDLNGIMRDVTADMTDEQIQAVASYLSVVE
ncbi:MAG TPA: c-type cytochrome [Candidatus Azoamicus sp. OHIO1]